MVVLKGVGYSLYDVVKLVAQEYYSSASRPGHYTVLHDENFVQIPAVYVFCMFLCLRFYRIGPVASRSCLSFSVTAMQAPLGVSVCQLPPIVSLLLCFLPSVEADNDRGDADKVCQRAKFHYERFQGSESAISDDETFDLAVWQTRFKSLHGDLIHSMYFL